MICKTPKNGGTKSINWIIFVRLNLIISRVNIFRIIETLLYICFSSVETFINRYNDL